MKSQTKKKCFMCLADRYVFGLALVGGAWPCMKRFLLGGPVCASNYEPTMSLL